MLWCPWVGSPASLLMDQLGGQGGSLSYATRPPKEQGGAVDLLHPGALGWCDLVLLVSSSYPRGVSYMPHPTHPYLEDGTHCLTNIPSILSDLGVPVSLNEMFVRLCAIRRIKSAVRAWNTFVRDKKCVFQCFATIYDKMA